MGYDIPQVEFRANFHKLNMAKYFNREERSNKLKPEMGLKKNIVRCWGRIIVDVLNFTRRDYALSGIPKGLKNVAQFYGQTLKNLTLEQKIFLTMI